MAAMGCTLAMPPPEHQAGQAKVSCEEAEAHFHRASGAHSGDLGMTKLIARILVLALVSSVAVAAVAPAEAAGVRPGRGKCTIC